MKATLNGCELFYEITGEGRPVVFLDGLTGRGDDWRYIGDELAAGLRLIAIDARGRGRSTNPSGQLSHRLIAEEWREIWADLVLLMRAGVQTGRIDTVHVAHTPEAMGRAPRVDRHGGEVYVYRRAGQPCLVCGSPVRTGTLAGRNSYWCQTCQPR